MQRTFRAAQRAASSASRSASSTSTRSRSTTTTTTTTTKTTSTRAAPLPYAPSQRTPHAFDPSSSPPPLPTTPAPQVKPGSPAYKTAAGKYTRAMIAMPILLLTSYVLYGRFAGGAEEKTLPGAEGQPRLVVLDK